MLTTLVVAAFATPMVETDSIVMDSATGGWSARLETGTVVAKEAEVEAVLANGTELVNTRKRGLAISVSDPALAGVVGGLTVGERRVVWLPEGAAWRPGAAMWMLFEGA